MYPAECRESSTTYKAGLNVVIQFLVEGQLVNSINVNMGQIPIMVKVSGRSHNPYHTCIRVCVFSVVKAV